MINWIGPEYPGDINSEPKAMQKGSYQNTHHMKMVDFTE